ncbi:DegT/DnrJ/EryC1/StrS family aminotransferase [Pseudonocardia tropica]|uniref:DegT/DnrJ/EryC1/StrS family aminotransferase n=1 Tax=Pseudonocardia tropica TaxID=681289 RepID=A0ABV1JXC6_9PSEU
MLSLGAREMAAAVRTLARGELSRYTAGGRSEVARLEAETCERTGTGHALAVASGTAALTCALVGRGVGPGDEVLVPAFTWVASAAAVLAVGAVPVLVDIDHSLTIDPLDAKRKITARTAAIMPVHMLNLVADMDALTDLAAENGLSVIEDAAQAVGVTHRGRRVGTIGDAGAFSFQQAKNVKAGEGGMMLTDDSRTATRALYYHDLGAYERDGWTRTDEPLFVGLNLKMSELTAAVLRPQMRRLDRQLELRRRRRAVVLDALLSSPLRGFTVAPHHDEASAVGLALRFEDPAQAADFARRRTARLLADSGRHVFTRWWPVLERRTHHPRIDPHGWAGGHADYSPASCPNTLPVLERTCVVDIAPELPYPAFRAAVRSLTSA